MGNPLDSPSPSLSELPHDTLVAYGAELGLSVNEDTPDGELLRVIRERQELLVDLERDALLDVVVWARLPVRRSASKEALAALIARIAKVRFDDLSERGLHALVRLRGLKIKPGETRASVEKRLRRQGGLWSRLRRKRRSVMGTLISRIIENPGQEEDYRFLPESEEEVSLKEHIGDAGVVGGIAQKLRGVADQYVEEKLDEIERRIDRKLDEIDARLGEWRDREISNRLRIIRLTLITAIIVAIISLGYDHLRERVLDRNGPRAPVAADERAE